MAATYITAPPEVISIAELMIEKHLPQLKAAHIGFLFRDKAASSKGKVVYGRARKAPPWLLPYKNLDFIIILAEDSWQDLNREQREALVLHELCHCVFDEDEESASIKAHDVEEFRLVINEYGLWNHDLLAAQESFIHAKRQQMPLFEDDKPKREGSVVVLDVDEELDDAITQAEDYIEKRKQRETA